MDKEKDMQQNKGRRESKKMDQAASTITMKTQSTVEQKKPMQQDQIQDRNEKNNLLEKIPFFILLFMGFSLPFFDLPFFGIPTAVSKTSLVFIGVAVAFFLWLVARLKDGHFVFPKSILLAIVGGISLTFLVSGIFSPAPVASLLGVGFNIGTFLSIFLLSILAFLVSIFFQSKTKIFYFYVSVFLSAGIVFLYQFVQYLFFTVDILPEGIFSGLPLNLVGSFHNMAMFFGLILILALTTIELISFSKAVRNIALVSAVLSLIALIAVNFYLLWFFVGFFALLIFVYGISFGQGGLAGVAKERKIPIASFGVILVSLFFILATNLISGTGISPLSSPQEDVRPSWQGTLGVAKDTLLEDPILGSGPNRFVNQWLTFKPGTVNTLPIWNVDFGFGVGVIPTFVITTGFVGLFVWLVFFAILLYQGFRSMLKIDLDRVSHYLIFSSFVGSLYLWLLEIFYVPNIVILAFAFFFTGIFIASLVKSDLVKNYDFSFLKDPRIGFVSVLILILLILSSIGGGYILLQKLISVGYYQKGVTRAATLDEAESYVVKAVRLNNNDLYYRTLSELSLLQLNNILSTQDLTQESVAAAIQARAQNAIAYALEAKDLDETNYLNWLSVARAYRFMVPFPFVDGNEFYRTAQQSYDSALAVNPNNPAIILEKARLALEHKDTEQAKTYIGDALAKKGNYIDAIFLLSQIQVDEGDIDKAIDSVRVASLLSPNDIGVFFQLGFLHYQNKDYSEAISAFKQAVNIDPSFANAKYFLGLSYYEIGRRSDAIKEFEDIQKTNPDNVEIRSILNNLKAGRSPFSQTGDIFEPPEDRDTLPLGDE